MCDRAPGERNLGEAQAAGVRGADFSLFAVCGVVLVAQALSDEEAVGGDSEAGVMVEAPPASALVVPEPQILLEVLVITLDAPSQVRYPHELMQCCASTS